MKTSEYIPLLKMAREAMGDGPNKWEANAELLQWFRADNCLEVILACQAASRVCSHPGGKNNQDLHKAMEAISPLQIGTFGSDK